MAVSTARPVESVMTFRAASSPLARKARPSPRTRVSRPGIQPSELVELACFAEIASRGLAAFAVLLNLIIDLLAVIQGGKPGAFDSRDVDENVRTATVGLNESKTFAAVEPFHCSSRHTRIPCTFCPVGRPEPFV